MAFASSALGIMAVLLSQSLSSAVLLEEKSAISATKASAVQSEQEVSKHVEELTEKEAFPFHNMGELRETIFNMLPDSLASSLWKVIERAVTESDTIQELKATTRKQLFLLLPDSMAKRVWDAIDRFFEISTTTTTTMPLEEAAGTAPAIPDFDFRAVCAEFIGMTLFVWVGCGSAMSIAKKEGSAWVLQVSLAFGLAITVLAYTIGHYSGAHMNGAVSLSLLVSAKIGPGQFFANLAAQLLGSILAASILEFMYGPDADCTGGLGTNGVAEGFSKAGALVGEIFGTFLLVFVVHETAVNKLGAANVALAPLAIGLAVFLAHVVLIPIDGCSINPTRSFGPAVVCSMTRKGATPWKDMWIFWAGPIVGALLGSLVYCWMRPEY